MVHSLARLLYSHAERGRERGALGQTGDGGCVTKGTVEWREGLRRERRRESSHSVFVMARSTLSKSKEKRSAAVRGDHASQPGRKHPFPTRLSDFVETLSRGHALEEDFRPATL